MNAIRTSLLVGLGTLAIALPVRADGATSRYQQEKDALNGCSDNGERSADDCRIAAEALVSQERKSMEHSAAVLRLLSDESLPTLRRLVQDSSNDDFHWGAVAALAYLGDSEIVDHLKIRQEQFKQSGDQRSAGSINHYLWMIDVQQSSEAMLAYIAEKPGVRVEERLWAIQRANDLKIAKEDIRQAILDHAEKVEPDKHGVRPGLGSVKRVAILLGILTEDDLPGVNYHRDLSDVVSE